MESWGDHSTRNGQVTFQQPVIAPLFNTKQKESLLLSWISIDEKEDDFYRDYLKTNLRDYVFDTGNYAVDFETFWNTALHDGAVNIASELINYSKFNQNEVIKSTTDTKGISLIIQNNNYFGTGKYSNNGWLQEIPHPVTKVTWDNYAAIAPETAKINELENDDLIKITFKDKEIELPIMIQPGMAAVRSYRTT